MDSVPEVGFLARRGYRRPELFALSRHRPKNRLGLHEIRPHIFYQAFWDFDGFRESSLFHAGSHWEFKNGHEIHTGFNVYDDGVKAPFQLHPGVIVPAGDYSRTEVQLVGFTNRGKPVGFEMTLIAGEFFDGDRVSLRPTLRFRKNREVSPASSPGSTTTSTCLLGILKTTLVVSGWLILSLRNSSWRA